jgi:hypothetical protein
MSTSPPTDNTQGTGNAMPKQNGREMSSPIEFRSYLRRMTLEDLNNGLQGSRGPVLLASGQQATDDQGKPLFAMFIPVGIQYRYQAKVYLDGVKALEWSPWIQIPMVKEGDEEAGGEG